jgi:hypothetical protein
MSISTWTTSNPKKIKEFRELMKRDAKQRLQQNKQQLRNFPDDNPDHCVFCEKLTTWGLIGVCYGAPVCPECAAKESS